MKQEYEDIIKRHIVNNQKISGLPQNNSSISTNLLPEKSKTLADELIQISGKLKDINLKLNNTSQQTKLAQQLGLRAKISTMRIQQLLNVTGYSEMIQRKYENYTTIQKPLNTTVIQSAGTKHNDTEKQDVKDCIETFNKKTLLAIYEEERYLDALKVFDAVNGRVLKEDEEKKEIDKELKEVSARPNEGMQVEEGIKLLGTMGKGLQMSTDDIKTKLNLHKPKELMEFYFIKARCLESLGEYDKAIRFLTDPKNRGIFIDHLKWKHMLVRLHMENKEPEFAIPILKNLIKQNPYNREYYLYLLRANKIDIEDQEEINEPKTALKAFKILEEYSKLYPDSCIIQRLEFDILQPTKFFKRKLIDYIKPFIQKKRLQPLMTELKPLY